jgi:peptidoglycan hydrolase-like protein with peptidoglycan-binding domain
MSSFKRIFLLGSILLLAAGLFTFGPMNSSKAFAASINGCPPTQTENSSGNNSSWVEVLQYNLNGIHQVTTFSFSTYPLTIDGSFGAKTETAVNAYQTWANISGGNGVVGSLTWSALGFCPGYSGHYADWGLAGPGTVCPPTQSENSSSNDAIFVKAIQDMLNLDYHYGYISKQSWTPYLSSDGSFGAQTKAAVIDFQNSLSLSPDGAVGPQTWAEFGMCF